MTLLPLWNSPPRAPSPTLAAPAGRKRRKTRSVPEEEEEASLEWMRRIQLVCDSDTEEITAKKRGRRPTTAEYIDRAEAQERLNEAKRKAAELEEDRKYREILGRGLSGELALEGDEEWTQEGDDLAAQLRGEPASELARRIFGILEGVRITGRKSKNMKGTMQRALKMSHLLGRVMVAEMARRMESSSRGLAPAGTPALAPAPMAAPVDEAWERERSELRDRIALLEGQLEERRSGERGTESRDAVHVVSSAQYSGSPVRRPGKRLRRGNTTSPLMASESDTDYVGREDLAAGAVPTAPDNALPEEAAPPLSRFLVWGP